MAITDETGGGVNGTMLMQPAGMPYGGNGFGAFGGDSIWIIILFFLLCGNGWGNWGGNNGTDSYVQRGFDQSAVMNGLTGINASLTSGFGDIQQSFANAEVAANARQMANMQQLFGVQSSLQNCCCENRAGIESLKYVVATENCADRAAVSDGIRDVIANQSANTQRILDQLCQDKIDAKNERIADLERQLTMANLAASQTAQTARILADNTAQTVALEQYLNPTPIPAYSVPNPNCCNQFNNCGA